ncbi:YlxM family DNA-binding protein [Aerococcaceae bacterium WGS1372]
MSLEKTVYISQLFSFYKSLLTEKQRDMLSLYYEEDLSLSEIAEEFDISRQGVHDNIRRGEKSLVDYERFLNLNDRRLKRMELLNQLDHLVKDEEASKLISQLLKLDE